MRAYDYTNDEGRRTWGLHLEGGSQKRSTTGEDGDASRSGNILNMFTLRDLTIIQAEGVLQIEEQTYVRALR